MASIPPLPEYMDPELPRSISPTPEQLLPRESPRSTRLQFHPYEKLTRSAIIPLRESPSPFLVRSTPQLANPEFNPPFVIRSSPPIFNPSPIRCKGRPTRPNRNGGPNARFKSHLDSSKKKTKKKSKKGPQKGPTKIDEIAKECTANEECNSKYEVVRCICDDILSKSHATAACNMSDDSNR